MKAQCSVTGCKREATHQAKFVIFPAGYPQSLPLEALAGMCACDFHATDQGGLEVLNHNLEGRRQIEASLNRAGYVAPDWTRSRCEWVPIEYEIDLDNEFLESGMKASEAVKKARMWWNHRGRQQLSHRLREAANIEEVGRTVKTGNGKTPGFVVQGDKQTVVQSGLLRGEVWDNLNKREQLEVVKQWHHYFVAAPLEGVAMMQDKH